MVVLYFIVVKETLKPEARGTVEAGAIFEVKNRVLKEVFRAFPPLFG
jgi:hypothetical protein